ncbi:DNA-processing protein DprA [Chryseobacterium sp.]|uniref:DNA-processing protein DprA n=1 Tax=Chryseobacterium sp. TaxID=1871047 RepID=UPI00289B0E66|nr:DNA-processing protein DprA [Chryseobacterium sp.]
MYTEEQLYSIALRECSNIGDLNFQKLVRNFGNAKTVWEKAKKEISKIPGVGKKIVSEIGNAEHLHFAEKELAFCEKNQIKIRLKHLDELPFLLSQCDDAPSILYQKGQYDEALKTVSLVGTRNITSYGKSFIESFFEEAGSKFISVSGLALGVDKEVHEHSIKNKIPTIGVLAHGFHTFYPSKNKALSQKIIEENGALFTEFNSSRKPDRENFIQRNRVIAGLSEATIVVETAFGGGSISTATFANGYNRDVYALPGKISDKYSQGCNHLIYQNKAAIISTIPELVNLLSFGKKEKIDELFPRSEIKVQLTDNQNKIYQSIVQNPHITLDDLASEIDISGHKILPVILELELMGRVKSFSGRQFVAIE